MHWFISKRKMDREKEIYNIAGWVEGRHSANFDDTSNQIGDQAAIDFFTRSKTGGQRIVVTSRAKAVPNKAQVIFEKLATQWYKDTLRLSGYFDKILHPAYQQIIGLGESVIPLILGELQDFPAEWFWALQSISRENPAASLEDVSSSDIAKVWIEWGKNKHYID